MSTVSYLDVLNDRHRQTCGDYGEVVEGEVLYDDPRYLVVHTDIGTIRIPHGRVIAIVDPKDIP